MLQSGGKKKEVRTKAPTTKSGPGRSTKKTPAGGAAAATATTKKTTGAGGSALKPSLKKKTSLSGREVRVPRRMIEDDPMFDGAVHVPEEIAAAATAAFAMYKAEATMNKKKASEQAAKSLEHARLVGKKRSLVDTLPRAPPPQQSSGGDGLALPPPSPHRETTPRAENNEGARDALRQEFLNIENWARIGLVKLMQGPAA